MNTHFSKLANYNVWANDLVHSWLMSINQSQWEMPLESSFPSIKDTCIHLLSAEHIWYERLIKLDEPTWLAAIVNGDKMEVLEKWKKASSDLLNYTLTLDEASMLELLYYKRINGEEYRQPLEDVLLHIFNHSTYHRGQLVTLLRQVGFKDIVSTDFLLYSRIT
jgi:uncharacterized damage-inducible protein DinB